MQGQLEPCGSVDFYMNGGFVQPGCEGRRTQHEHEFQFHSFLSCLCDKCMKSRKCGTRRINFNHLIFTQTWNSPNANFPSAIFRSLVQSQPLPLLFHRVNSKWSRFLRSPLSQLVQHRHWSLSWHGRHSWGVSRRGGLRHINPRRVHCQNKFKSSICKGSHRRQRRRRELGDSEDGCAAAQPLGKLKCEILMRCFVFAAHSFIANFSLVSAQFTV